jgi:hypothetical protein
MQRLTMGRAVRMIERHPYVVVCHETGARRSANGMRQAMAFAKAMAARMPGHPIHIHLPSGCGPGVCGPDSLVASVTRSGSSYKVRFNQALHGLGNTLNDWACSSNEFVSAWRDRVNASLDGGAKAAVLGGVLAGLVGGLAKRPLLGAAAGALLGWGTHAVWTGPQRLRA